MARLKRPLALGVWLAMVVATTAGAATLTRRPYLQSVASTSALIAFRTDAACPAAVRFGPGSLVRQAPSAVTGIQHAVVLTGLSPSTEYHYVVDACGAQVS